MNPQIEAAVIAGIVSIVSLGGTVFVAFLGFRTTVKATKMTADEAHTDTAATLEAQRVQLDRTLEEQHIRTLNERFATAAEKLGSDKPPAVRLAGVYAMAGLADDWGANRQTCVDVLCAYLRLRYARGPGDGEEAQMAFQDDREVRHTVIRVITAHLQKDKEDARSWQGLNFDFTGVVFDGGSFSGAQFSGGAVSFAGAEFSGGAVSFDSARFTTGGTVRFSPAAKFTGGTVSFIRAEFSGGEVYFNAAEFTDGTVSFGYADFTGGTVSFSLAKFTGGAVSFDSARFTTGGTVRFSRAQFIGSTVYFNAWFVGGEVRFDYAKFAGGEVRFNAARFGGGTVSFDNTEFTTGGAVNFGGAVFSGGTVRFSYAKFSGGTVDFSRSPNWSHPPLFDWNGEPPAGVMLPAGIGGESQ